MNPKNIVIAALSAALVYDVFVARINKKNFNALRDSRNKIKRSQVQLQKELIDANRRARYLAVKLDSIGVPVTEFEEIIFDNLLKP